MNPHASLFSFHSLSHSIIQLLNQLKVAPPVEVVQSPSVSSANNQSQASKGGQVIESGVYHLEFVPEVENNGTHLDFYLQKSDNHEAIFNAKVTAQIRLPDGTQKSLSLAYDAGGKHYAALLPEKTSGEYNVAILSDISGEKVNGRFTFKRQTLLLTCYSL